MAKTTKRRAPRELTRKQVSRIKREQRAERLLVWSVIGVTVVVVGVLAYGFIVEEVVKSRQAVATVGDTAITTAEFQARVRFARMQMTSELNYLYQQQQMLDPTDSEVQFLLEYLQNNIVDLQSQLGPENALVIGENSLEQLIQEQLVRREAQARAISVAPQDVNVAIEQFFGYDSSPVLPTLSPSTTLPLAPSEVVTSEPTVTPPPTPTPMTEAEFRQRYDNFLKGLRDLNITEQQYRSWVESSLLLEKLQEQMTAEAPATADQVLLRYVTVDDEERAAEAVTRLNAGEDFQALLDELRADEEISAYGSELDWLPKTSLESRFEPLVSEIAFSLAVGERSQPIPSEDGERFTVIEVLGHEERELDEYLRQQYADQAFQEWLDSQQVLVVRGTYSDRVPTDP
jgi:parvulin-like peptidyl-prolyl isomerase